MKTKFVLSIIALFVSTIIFAQQKTHSLQLNVAFSKNVATNFKSNGRLFLFLNTDPNAEPRTQIWPSKGNFIFGRNYTNLQSDKILKINESKDWAKTVDWTFENIPEGDYFLQILWDQDTEESTINAPGNIYSNKQKITVDKSSEINILLDQTITPWQIDKNDLVREINFKSDTLSKFWGKPMYIKTSILLPRQYKESEKKAYPIRYNISGFADRYTRVNRLTSDKDFMNWWTSEAPRIINVFLDGEGPFGDSYQMDSDNSGPYGDALVHELIPYIEAKYRGTTTPETRFVDGCSTGGWVSLALQIFYPETFNGSFSYSPDAVDFDNYQLINIYKDKNAFTNEYGYLRPVCRDSDGEPNLSLKEFIQYENVLSSSDNYLKSGGQFGAHAALYSPKGKNGLALPMFDSTTGLIDSAVADAWKKYDLKLYVQKNWPKLGPKLQNKIYIWMGDMDNFYLNNATRSFSEYLQTTQNPKSNAEIIVSPMQGHCQQYSDRAVLEQILKRIGKLKRKTQ